MKKENLLLQNISVGLLIFGFIIYVVVDSNLFSSFSNLNLNLGWTSENQSLSKFENKKQEFEMQLQTALKDLENRKADFYQTARQIKALETDIKRGHADLEKLQKLYAKLLQEKEVLTLQNEEIKRKFSQSQARSMATQLNVRKPARQTISQKDTSNPQTIDQLSSEVAEIQNWNQLYQKLQSESSDPVHFEAVRDQERDYLKFTHDRLFDRDSIYLRPTGIQFSRSIAASAISLGATGLQVTYSQRSNKKRNEEKARVVENYLKKIVGDSIEVRRKEVIEHPDKSDSTNDENVELWVDLSAPEKLRSDL